LKPLDPTLPRGRCGLSRARGTCHDQA